MTEPNRSPLAGATILFDLDGTLVDSAPDLVGALNTVLEEQRLAAVPLARARGLVGQGARALIARGFALAEQPLGEPELDRLTARFLDIYRGRIAEATRPFPHLEGALDRLSADGATLAVCTNKSSDLSVQLLDALGLAERFAAVIGHDRAPARKPDPRHVLAAIAAAGGDPARALMVGDTDADVIAAKTAGVPAIAVGFGYSATPVAELGADAVIEDFAELPGVALRLLAAARAPA
jgi:phosphoglycolate phosphatase